MPRNLIVILGLTVTVLLLSGCVDEHKTKTGVIVKVEQYDIGGTFSDVENEICYLDGSKLYLVGYRLRIIYNVTSTITYRTFEYEGNKYNSFVEINHSSRV